MHAMALLMERSAKFTPCQIVVSALRLFSRVWAPLVCLQEWFSHSGGTGQDAENRLSVRTNLFSLGVDV